MWANMVDWTEKPVGICRTGEVEILWWLIACGKWKEWKKYNTWVSDLCNRSDGIIINGVEEYWRGVNF